MSKAKTTSKDLIELFKKIGLVDKDMAKSRPWFDGIFVKKVEDKFVYNHFNVREGIQIIANKEFDIWQLRENEQSTFFTHSSNYMTRNNEFVRQYPDVDRVLADRSNLTLLVNNSKINKEHRIMYNVKKYFSWIDENNKSFLSVKNSKGFFDLLESDFEFNFYVDNDSKSNVKAVNLILDEFTLSDNRITISIRYVTMPCEFPDYQNSDEMW